jgi:hypothetical protein
VSFTWDGIHHGTSHRGKLIAQVSGQLEKAQGKAFFVDLQ